MKFSLDTNGLPQNDIFEKIKMASFCGFQGIEPWFHELSETPLSEIKQCLTQHKIELSSMQQLRGWFELDGHAMKNRTQSWLQILKECEKRMVLAKELNCPYIIAVPPIDNKGILCSFEDGAKRFKQLINLGSEIGCLPLIEFCGQTSRIRDVSSCLKFMQLVDHENCKMILDAYHLWRCGNDMSQALWINHSDVLLLHVSDANPLIERQNHKDKDRIIPGDGIIDLNQFLQYSIILMDMFL